MTWMKDEWQRYYEHVFVQTKLISPLRRFAYLNTYEPFKKFS